MGISQDNHEEKEQKYSLKKGREIELSTSVNTSPETQLGRSISSQNFLERLAERIGINARASTVFADPVEKDGVTVIPVAKARWGIGGGAGSGKNPDQSQTDEGSGAEPAYCSLRLVTSK